MSIMDPFNLALAELEQALSEVVTAPRSAEYHIASAITLIRQACAIKDSHEGQRDLGLQVADDRRPY